MVFLETKFKKILSKDPVDYIFEKSQKKRSELKLKEREEYIKLVNDIHDSNVPEEVRNTEINYSFRSDFSDTSIRTINKKIDEFLKWYYKNWIKGHYTDIGEFSEQKDIINFIEKMASWYEMRYPNFEINRLMPGTDQENKYVDDILLNRNLDCIGWVELFDYNAFLQTLSGEELWYLRKPSFKQNYYFKNADMGTLFISEDGKVEAKEIRLNIAEHHHNMVIGRTLYITEDFDGLNLLQVKLMMEKYEMQDDIDGIQEVIDNYQQQIEARERILDCVMYRIIERGGNRMGPRRAFLFAKDFGRNIDIPMMYGVDYSDPGLRKFMNEYIKAGGSKDLVCCTNYFSRSSENDKLETTTIQELINTTWNNCATKYTSEEDELHQRLVNAIATSISQEELKQEQGKQLKLQKKKN